MPPHSLTINHTPVLGSGKLYFQDKLGHFYEIGLKEIKDISMEASYGGCLTQDEYQLTCTCDSITVTLCSYHKEVDEQEVKNLMED